jgi:hypothetical protein
MKKQYILQKVLEFSQVLKKCFRSEHFKLHHHSTSSAFEVSTSNFIIIQVHLGDINYKPGNSLILQQ